MRRMPPFLIFPPAEDDGLAVVPFPPEQPAASMATTAPRAAIRSFRMFTFPPSVLQRRLVDRECPAVGVQGRRHAKRQCRQMLAVSEGEFVQHWNTERFQSFFQDILERLRPWPLRPSLAPLALLQVAHDHAPDPVELARVGE